MSISFECKACGADFDLEFSEIVESPDVIKCDNCGSAPPGHRNHQFSTALEDFLSAIVAIRNKVSFEIELDSDNLPAPYGSVGEGDDQGGLDGGLAFGQQDNSPRELNEDSEDEEDEMDGMSEVDEDEEEEEKGNGNLGFSAFGDDDDDDDDFDDDDEFDDDDFGELDDFDELDDYDELEDDDDDDDEDF